MKTKCLLRVFKQTKGLRAMTSQLICITGATQTIISKTGRSIRRITLIGGRTKPSSFTHKRQHQLSSPKKRWTKQWRPFQKLMFSKPKKISENWNRRVCNFYRHYITDKQKNQESNAGLITNTEVQQFLTSSEKRKTKNRKLEKFLQKWCFCCFLFHFFFTALRLLSFVLPTVYKTCPEMKFK